MRTRALLAATTAATLLPAATALAHPSFNPNDLPAGDRYDVDFVVPHGCGTEGGMPEEGAAASPTVEIAVELADGLTAIEPRAVDGWTTRVDEQDGEPTGVTWLDDGGATTEPIVLPVTVEIAGEVDAQVDVPVYQACENGEDFRWIGTPEAEAEYPAARLFVAAHGSDPGPASADPDGGSDHGGDGGDMGGTDHGGATSEEAVAGGAGTSEPATSGSSPPASAAPSGQDADPAAVEDGGGTPWWLLGVLAGIVAVAVAAVRRRA